MGKPDVVSQLVDTVLQYDLVAVQEIKDIDQTVPYEFLDELNNAWNAVASKMYDSAKEDGSPQADEATSSKKKGKNKKKDDAEIEDADFEVVD